MKYTKMENTRIIDEVVRTHPAFKELLHIFSDIHEQHGDRFFLVGGFVRDILLGLPSEDIDIAVEGSLGRVIEAVNERIDSEYIYYERFQTATLTLEDFKVDLITCRKESYEHDGALPKIIPGSLEDDIWRRDFTINALAIDVSAMGTYTLCGPKLAESDLKAGKIRILHEGSFQEDPTRIFRAIRYMCRLGFALEESTKKEMAQAIEKGALNNISSARILTELCRDLNEKKAYAILLEYKAWHIDPYIAKDLKLPDKLSGDLELIHRLEFRFIEDTESFDPCELRLLTLFHHNYSQAAFFIEKFHLSKRFSNMLLSMERLNRSIVDATSGIKSSEIYRRFYDIQDEVLLTLYVCTDTMLVKNIIERYYTDLKNARNPLKGSDLLKIGVQPGPRVQELLNDVMNAYLDGIIESREDAIKYVQAHM
jgi:tRNA nucleotidyltransferase (CCA-adding enzyme)